MNEPEIEYLVQYQPLRKGAERPEDWGQAHAFGFEGKSDAPMLPQVGDFVQLIPVGASKGYLSFHGRVRSRLFRQFTQVAGPDGEQEPTKIVMAVNIVVEETNDDWGKLIKE